MMQITLCAVGRMKKGPLLDLVREYEKRLDWRLDLKEIETKPGLKGDTLKKAEEESLLAKAPKGALLIALDETGKNLTSLEFSQTLQEAQFNHGGKVCFLIGGADGLSAATKSQADRLISFGRTTWPHMLVRVMLLEQIYRAQQILKGHPYHRE